MGRPYKLKRLVNFGLRARDGEIGELEEILFDDRRWTVRYFVVRTGGWLWGRKVLIVPAVVTGFDEAAARLDVDLSREQIENSPPLESHLPVSRHYEHQYYQYYGWQPYWLGDPIFSPPTGPAPAPQQPPTEPEHPHLRSSAEVKGYRLSARDGEIGHVEDFVVQWPEWSVRYLEVDTRNWLPGKHVLIAPDWIGRVDWARREVTVHLPREAIQTAPAYDASQVIGDDYQVALSKHYRRQFDRDRAPSRDP
jgi:hypothetical protein